MNSNSTTTPLRVLFVDDDTDESYLFNEALEHAGLFIELSRAKNGNDLLSYLNNEPLPDLVFIDLNMPYKDGLEALTEIRKQQKFKELPLVIYSTTKNDIQIDSSYEHGANLFVVKPNNFDGMVQVVKKVCTIDWKNFRTPKREEFLILSE
jgi:CheY-like chemotaxis protein